MIESKYFESRASIFFKISFLVIIPLNLSCLTTKIHRDPNFLNRSRTNSAVTFSSTHIGVYLNIIILKKKKKKNFFFFFFFFFFFKVYQYIFYIIIVYNILFLFYSICTLYSYFNYFILFYFYFFYSI